MAVIIYVIVSINAIIWPKLFFIQSNIPKFILALRQTNPASSQQSLGSRWFLVYQNDGLGKQ
jgi:hypothetical protein